jgi:hypothetical protein
MLNKFKDGYKYYFNDYFLFENNYYDNNDFDDDIDFGNNDNDNNNNNLIQKQKQKQKQKQEILYNPENL